MVALRPRPKGSIVAPFGLCTFAFALVPAPIGTQDLVALFAQKAAAAESRPAALASPFGTIHPANFSFPRPLGTAIPQPIGHRLASLDPAAAEVTGSIAAATALETLDADPAADFPRIDRRRKGDRLAPAIRAPAAAAAPDPAPVSDFEWAGLAPGEELPISLATTPTIAEADPPEDGVWPVMSIASLVGVTGPAMRTAGLYFEIDSLRAPRSPFEWNQPQDPFERPAAELEADIPLPQMRPDDGAIEQAAAAATAATKSDAGGETIAKKGEVTGKDQQPRAPAERLRLTGAQRAKAEKCLADAVYFEARGEPVRGQIAVAQVVMNRVFSQFYPDNVCDVVYQNAHRRLACQFTFACDGIPEIVNDPDAWKRAQRIAKDTLDGRLWLNSVGKATHYHAYWVHPWWVSTMRKLHRIGVHTFYRPRRWGDGSDEPIWGSARLTAEMVKRL
jgi:spore germination cell wall hydrolase CwlJ-like protein